MHVTYINVFTTSLFFVTVNTIYKFFCFFFFINLDYRYQLLFMDFTSLQIIIIEIVSIIFFFNHLKKKKLFIIKRVYKKALSECIKELKVKNKRMVLNILGV